jgi:mevalonate kinase
MTDNTLKRSFPAKILLFGEYTVLQGGLALAIPLNKYTGRWNFLPDTSIIWDEGKEWAQYIRPQIDLGFEYERFISDIENGLYFESDIPIGYGLGSSGSLSAALFASYCNNLYKDLPDLKSKLSRIESFFHGQSSGTDPLVSYLNKSVLLGGNENMKLLDIRYQDVLDGFFLLDSGKGRNTDPLVQSYLEKIMQPEFKDAIESNLLPLGDSLIRQFLSNEWNTKTYFEFSAIQLELFGDRIPHEIQEIWNIGLTRGSFGLKLCGAGDGGFFLGYSNLPKNEINIGTRFPIIFL